MTNVDMKEFYEQLAAEIHADNIRAGWWDNPDECLYQKLQLVSTEIAEATEGARKDLMDDHLPNRKMEEVEYADAMIRILDLGGRLELEYDPETDAHPYCLPTNTVGHQQLGINATIVNMADSIRNLAFAPDQPTIKRIVSYDYSKVINSISTVSHIRSCDVLSTLYEKRLYNAQRADHKRENRAKTNGKKF